MMNLKIASILTFMAGILYSAWILGLHIYTLNAPNLGKPVSWQCSKSSTMYNSSTKVFVGIFTTKENARRREIIRSTYLQHKPDNIYYKFIIGSTLSKELREEMDQHHDILPLDIEENMNQGKTLEYYRLLTDVFKGSRMDFILKADDDAYLQLERIYDDLSLTSRNMSYWGYLVGDTFMGGECYGLSYDLASWVASSPIPKRYKSGHEDSQIQKWFKWASIDKNVNYQVRNCRIHDHIDSGTVYSKEIDVNNTMVVHYLKKDDMFKDVHRKLYPTFHS